MVKLFGVLGMLIVGFCALRLGISFEKAIGHFVNMYLAIVTAILYYGIVGKTFDLYYFQIGVKMRIFYCLLWVFGSVFMFGVGLEDWVFQNPL